MNNERDNARNHEQGYDKEALKDAATERSRELATERERSAEKSKEISADSARHEALEHASKAEREAKVAERTKEASPVERRGPLTKREKDASFNATMKEVRSQLSGPSRAFSNVIHNPVVEKVSDAVGGTVARPNAILSGSVFAFLFTLAIYFIARLNGYPLSGAETIASFFLGWILGLVFDYFRLLILGKK